MGLMSAQNMIMNNASLEYAWINATTENRTFDFDIYDVNGNCCLSTGEPDFQEYLESMTNDRVSLLMFLFLFSFATVFGNSLVILAVVRERYLHTATNYFVTSLAVADCLVGLVVMPFSALYEVLEKTWFFGTDWCDIWRSLDVLFSTASILNLCVISLDRYWAITDPFSYPMRMTRNRAAVLICAVWICSGAISFPAIVWWRAARDGEMPPYKCIFTEHLGYLVFSSTISFYLPLLVMVFTYCRIYRAAVVQTRSLKIGTKQVLMASGELQLTLRIHRGGTTREPHHHSHHHHHHHHSSATTMSTPEEPEEEPLSALHNNGLVRHRHLGKNFSLSRKLAKFAKEKKAAKTLGIVMGVFIVCWLPFFVVNLLSGFCIQCIAHEEIVSAVVTWLGWINSSMNPVIYACWSRDFRRAFVRILCVCCPRKVRRKYQPTMRSKSQCQVAAMVAASTSVSYSSVNQYDSNRSIMRRQLSNCSSCSGNSSCGRSGSQRERRNSCTRCQSFHRHHYRRGRRRNSQLTLSTLQPQSSIAQSTLVTTMGAGHHSGSKHCTFATTTTTIPDVADRFGSSHPPQTLIRSGGIRKKQLVRGERIFVDDPPEHKPLQNCPSAHSQSSNSSNSSTIRIID